MKIIPIVPTGPYLPQDTKAQAHTIDALESGLWYAVQARAAVSTNGTLLPIFTDGDGDYCAIARNGETVSL